MTRVGKAQYTGNLGVGQSSARQNCIWKLYVFSYVDEYYTTHDYIENLGLHKDSHMKFYDIYIS